MQNASKSMAMPSAPSSSLESSPATRSSSPFSTLSSSMISIYCAPFLFAALLMILSIRFLLSASFADEILIFGPFLCGNDLLERKSDVDEARFTLWITHFGFTLLIYLPEPGSDWCIRERVSDVLSTRCHMYSNNNRSPFGVIQNVITFTVCFEDRCSTLSRGSENK